MWQKENNCPHSHSVCECVREREKYFVFVLDYTGQKRALFDQKGVISFRICQTRTFSTQKSTKMNLFSFIHSCQM